MAGKLDTCDSIKKLIYKKNIKTIDKKKNGTLAKLLRLTIILKYKSKNLFVNFSSEKEIINIHRQWFEYTISVIFFIEVLLTMVTSFLLFI